MMLIEAMYEDLAAHLKPGMKGKCPMLRRLSEYLGRIEAENNGRIIIEFGLVDDGDWDCSRCR